MIFAKLFKRIKDFFLQKKNVVSSGVGQSAKKQLFEVKLNLPKLFKTEEGYPEIRTLATQNEKFKNLLERYKKMYNDIDTFKKPETLIALKKQKAKLLILHQDLNTQNSKNDQNTLLNYQINSCKVHLSIVNSLVEFYEKKIMEDLNQTQNPKKVSISLEDLEEELRALSVQSVDSDVASEIFKDKTPPPSTASSQNKSAR